MIEPPEYIIKIAVAEASKSHCLSKRGAVIYSSRGDRYGQGYNYLPHHKCTKTQLCKSVCRHRTVHAEIAALEDALQNVSCKAFDEQDVFCVHARVDTEGSLMVSGPPSCMDCARELDRRLVKGVWLCHKEGWHYYEIKDFYRLSMLNDRNVKQDLANHLCLSLQL